MMRHDDQRRRSAGGTPAPRGHWLRLAAGALAVTAGVLFSPLFWVIANPLVVRTPPSASDAVIVFGGGVRNDGSASKSTRERTQQAVALYRQGVARTLILSTGFVTRVSEAQVMHDLVRSAGIPEDDVLLEERSTNTWENVLCTAEVLRRHGWTRAIVVTSPYHMRRVWLVVRKCCSDLTVSYVPANPSWFFNGHGLRHRLGQVGAVLHEYVGIGWYWMRGRL